MKSRLRLFLICHTSPPLLPIFGSCSTHATHSQIRACCSLFAQLTADTTHDLLVHRFADHLHPLPLCDAFCIRICEHGETRLRCTVICTGSISRVRSGCRSCGSRDRAGCTSRSLPRRGIHLKAMFAPVSTPLPSFGDPSSYIIVCIQLSKHNSVRRNNEFLEVGVIVGLGARSHQPCASVVHH